MAEKVPLFKSYWEEGDIKAVKNVIKRGTYWATGPEIEEFENKLSKYIGTDYAVAFNSGTSALHAILLAHGINSGEVIVPSFSFIATANCVLMAGAKPVFGEIEDRSYGLNPEDVKERISSKTKALVPVHYGGAPCRKIEALNDIAEDHNLLLVEDAAESLGSKISNMKVGTFGDSAMLSFCQNKVITTGEGGAIVTDSKKVCQKLKLIRSHGRNKGGSNYFSSTEPMEYVELGYNFRMPTILAALGISQLDKIDKVIDMRREKASYYNKKLSDISGIKVPTTPKEHLHVYQLYTIRLENQKIRDELKDYLTEKTRVSSKIYFNPIHLTKFYRKKFGFEEGDLPETERISKQVLSLPIYPDLEKKEIDYIIQAFIEFFGER